MELITLAGAANFVIGYITGKAVDGVFATLLGKRVKAAQNLLLEDLAEGATLPVLAAQEDELLGIMYRYFRAATDGAARLNMRLLAGVVAGQREQGTLSADKFLYYADILASLSREEVIALGVLYKETLLLRKTEAYQTAEYKEQFILNAFEKARVEVEKQSLPIHFRAVMTALTRTGLVTSHVNAPYIAKDLICTPLMDEVWREAKFDKVLRKEGIFKD